MDYPRPDPAGWGSEERTVPGAERLSRAALAGSLALAFLLVAVLLVMLVRQSRQAPASLAAAAVWAEREAALRARLQAVPGDDRARLRLAGVLIEGALAEARDSSVGQTVASGPDAIAYEIHLGEALWLSPRLTEARQLAEQVATQGQDPHRRGEAWARLARMHWLLGTTSEGTACMHAAVREDAAYRDTLFLPTR